MKFSEGFQMALKVIKQELDYNIWEESGRMRINYSHSKYEFFNLAEFFEKIDEICLEIFNKNRGMYYTVELLRMVFRQEKDKFTKKPINQIASQIGMQNQYLANAIFEGKVIGEIANGDDYHSVESWVDVDSVKSYVRFRYDNHVISKEDCVKYLNYLNSFSE